MARRLICVVAGCDDLAEEGGNRCAVHAASIVRSKENRSESALTWRKLYKDPRWKKLRRQFLARNPICSDCAEFGLVVLATDVDHIERHMGDLAKAFDWKNLQGLCHRCHSRKTAREVFHGQDEVWSIPFGLQQSKIPVEVVVGPPAAGKSHYVSAHAAFQDHVIDLDLYIAQVGGKIWDQRREIVKQAFSLRNAALRGLSDARSGKAWVPILGQSQEERKAWLNTLGPLATLTVIAPPKEVVLAQLMADQRRNSRRLEMIAAIERWYQVNPG